MRGNPKRHRFDLLDYLFDGWALLFPLFTCEAQFLLIKRRSFSLTP